MKKKPIILIDCDGVLADFLSMAEELIRKKIGFIPSSYNNWDIFKHDDVINHAGDIFNTIKTVTGSIRNLDKYSYTDEMILELRKIGDLVACTSILEGIYPSERVTWLIEEVGFNKNDIILAHRKELVFGDVLIDDKPENIINWQQEHPNKLACLWQPPKKSTNVPNGVFSTGNLNTLLSKIKEKYEV